MTTETTSFAWIKNGLKSLLLFQIGLMIKVKTVFLLRQVAAK